MPDLVKLIIRNGAIGFLVSAIFTAFILVSDMGGVGTLVMTSSSGPLAAILLFFFMGLTFGSAQIGFVIMSGKDDVDGGGRKQNAPMIHQPALIPAKIPTRLRR